MDQQHGLTSGEDSSEEQAAAERAREIHLTMDLCLRIGEMLLSSGAGAADVTATMRSVADHLGLRHAEIDVTFTALSMSHQRSPDDVPMLMLRHVQQRDIDYEDLTAVDHLVRVASEVHELAGGRMDTPERLHKELLRNTVEVVTGICDTVGEATHDLRETLAVVAPAAAELGVDLLGAGSHPFADWSHQQLTEGHRYEELINRTQWWGRQMLIWGVHVHVGMPERDRVMPVLASMLTTYPHLLALSASSPIGPARTPATRPTGR